MNVPEHATIVHKGQ